MKIRVISDRVIIREPERFVRLHIKRNRVAEVLVCPCDFDQLIDTLKSYSPVVGGLRIYGDIATSMQRLGLIGRTARMSWYPTKLFDRHAAALKGAFLKRYNRICELEDRLPKG